MNKNSPRWLKEIPKPISIGKSELTDKQKEDAKKFEEAIENGTLENWLNK